MGFSLSATNVVKRYGGVTALADGNLSVASGEVVALLGANGSGKSTLSKIITGVVSPNDGKVLVDNAVVSFGAPRDARRLGITAVYQEFSLVPELTVSENIWLSHEPLSGFLVNRRRLRDDTQKLLDLFAGVSGKVATDIPIKELTPDERQIVEILKALSRNPRLIILDEATASLDTQQVNRLFELVARWKAQGMAIIFVSHRMDEIFRVADRAVVLRSGRTVGEKSIGETNRQELVGMMIEGAELRQQKRVLPVNPDATVRISVKNLHNDTLKHISFDVRDGELLGIGGLQGQGQSALLKALFGDQRYQGEVIVSGQTVTMRHPKDAMKHAIALVPGDRGTEGLLFIRSILENMTLPSWTKFGLPLNMTKARDEANTLVTELNIKMGGLELPVSSLSGGNAQKVVIAKWLSRRPKVLLLNDPTKGIDVGAKVEFYGLLEKLQQQGTAIVLYSSDDDELLGLCNRVLVMQDGSITAELRDEQLNHSNLVAASMGTHHQTEATV